MTHLTASQLIQLVLDSFEAERTGNTKWGRELMSPDFIKTSMQLYKGKPFHRFELANDTANAVENVYAVEGREFHVWRSAANEETQTVFIELAEVQPEQDGPHTLWIYSLVCDIKDGRIAHTRHYGDPALLKSGLTPEHVRLVVEGGAV